ncbi:MAG: Fic family protein [Cellulomonadaceae bacterium]|jgi:Fic family protein|nr:Fic family protein [Cellulomonadaceae bacterium]
MMTATSTPPFSITVQAADYLAKIVESITRLDLGTDFQLGIRLHRENRVRSIYSSLAIEGNPLSLAQVTALLDGKRVLGRPADIHEVKNAREAYDHLPTLDPFQVDDFLTAHQLLTQGLIKEAGQFRSGDVAVYEGDTPVHTGARPLFVPNLVSDLFTWARESDLHPVLLSAVVHCEIETIHPFADGNGRMGRLWQTLILTRWNKVFAALPMEAVIFENRPQYYQALRTSQRDNDATKFLEFSLSAILSAIESVLVTYSAIFDGRNGGRSGGRNLTEAVLAALRVNPNMTGANLSNSLGVSRRTIDRQLSNLKAAGRLHREGSTKAGIWVVIDS